jgi:hypothetical protein
MLLDEYTPSQFARSALKEFVSCGHKTYTPNAQIRAITGTAPSKPIGRETLDRAKYILDEYCVVAGTTDQFDAPVLLMKERLNWPFPPFYVRSRVGSQKRKRAVPESVKDRIWEQNRWDLRLYDLVSRRLRTEIEQLGSPFQKRLRRFQRCNRVFGTLAYYPLQGFQAVRNWGKQHGLFFAFR